MRLLFTFILAILITKCTAQKWWVKQPYRWPGFNLTLDIYETKYPKMDSVLCLFLDDFDQILSKNSNYVACLSVVDTSADTTEFVINISYLVSLKYGEPKGYIMKKKPVFIFGNISKDIVFKSGTSNTLSFSESIDKGNYLYKKNDTIELIRPSISENYYSFKINKGLLTEVKKIG